MGSFGNNGRISTTSLNDNLKNVEGLTEGYPVSSLPARVIVDGYKIKIESKR